MEHQKVIPAGGNKPALPDVSQLTDEQTPVSSVTTLLQGATAGKPNPRAILHLQRPIGNRAVQRLLQKNAAPGSQIQRVVQLRPPGRGEASGFARAPEFVERLNAQSPAIQYSLDADGRTLLYNIVDEPALTFFDRKMRDFIDLAAVLPMRLINHQGLVGGQQVTVDFFDLAYVDIDDMLASDDHSFRMNLIHFLTERGAVRNFDRRIGTTFSDAEFDRAHNAGLREERDYLRDLLGDPTIGLPVQGGTGNNVTFTCRSREGYRVIHRIVNAGGRGVHAGTVTVRKADGTTVSIEDFQRERAAAAGGGAGAGGAP